VAPIEKFVLSNFRKRVISEEARDLLQTRGDQLHVVILWLTGLFGATYAGINFFRGDSIHSYLNISLLPTVGIAYLLHRKGYTVVSKVVNLCCVTIVIACHSLILSPKTFILAFYFPVIISTLIVFQGEKRRLGYLLTFFVFSILIFLLTTNLQILGPVELSPSKLKTEWLMNLSGAAFVTILEVAFIMAISNRIQEQLIVKSDNLITNNQILNSTINTREKLISILSHDLRGPLVLMQSGLEMLNSDGLPEADKQKIISELRKKTASTSNLLLNLLLWSRNQTDQIHFKPESLNPQNLERLVKTCISLFQGEKSINISAICSTTSSLFADKNMLDAILRNLTSNAVKFTPLNGEISISCLEHADFIEFQVKDSGIGMSTEDLAALNQGDAISRIGTNREKGHGLGLQLVRDFLVKHDSKLEITSIAGNGSVFSFRLNKQEGSA